MNDISMFGELLPITTVCASSYRNAAEKDVYVVHWHCKQECLFRSLVTTYLIHLINERTCVSRSCGWDSGRIPEASP